MTTRMGFCLVSLVFLSCPAGAADLWVAGTNPAVISANDCGLVTAVSGAARIRRSFQTEKDAGLDANVADRVNAGDELVTDAGGRIEIAGGANNVIVIGQNARLKLNALRTFAGPSGKQVARLDMELLAGQARVQVRLNTAKPEHVFISCGGMEVLASRGDIAVAAGDVWLAAGLAEGEAVGRTRRGQVTGAPFPIEKGRLVTAGGAADLDDAAAAAMKTRLPFSFELTSVALPPMPSVRPDLEAP